MAKLTLGYKASAEQFAPTRSAGVRRCCRAERVRQRGGQRPLSALEPHRRPRAALVHLAGGARPAHLQRQAGHQRRHADVPLPPGDHRPDDGHARSALAGPGLPGGGHRRVAERGRRAGHQVARLQGAVRAAARVDRADAPALDRRPRLLPGRVLPDPRRDGVRQADRHDAAVRRGGRRLGGEAGRARRRGVHLHQRQGLGPVHRDAAAGRQGGRRAGRTRLRQHREADRDEGLVRHGQDARRWRTPGSGRRWR